MFWRSSKKREQIAFEFAILGRLLASMPLMDGLELVGTIFGDRHVPWSVVRLRVAYGSTLADALKRDTGTTDLPNSVMAAIDAGERDGSLPRSLADSGDIWAAEQVASVEEGGLEAVELVNELLAELAKPEYGAAELRFETPAPEARLTLTLSRDGRPETWRQVEAGLARRVWNRLLVLCGIPYWSPERHQGTLRMRSLGGTTEYSVELDPAGRTVIVRSARHRK